MYLSLRQGLITNEDFASTWKFVYSRFLTPFCHLHRSIDNYTLHFVSNISPVQYPHCLVSFRLVYVLTCAPRPTTLHHSTPPLSPSLSSSVLPQALAEFMLENHPLCPLSSSDLRPRDKAIKRTLRLTVALTMAVHGVVTGRRA